MSIRRFEGVVSSLTTAAFRTVVLRDRRGLVYRLRKEIMTQRWLHRELVAPASPSVLSGRIKTYRGTWLS